MKLCGVAGHMRAMTASSCLLMLFKIWFIANRLRDSAEYTIKIIL